jgi:hypothetical protein
MLLDWLKRMTQTGQSIIPPGAPGSNALQSAGLASGMLQGVGAPQPNAPQVGGMMGGLFGG